MTKYFDRKLAVVIGINEYGHGIAPLQTAVQDAQALGATLTTDHGYQVVECLDDAATLTALRELFEEKIPQMVNSQDCLLIYFAGHGIAKQASPNGDKPGSPETEGPVGYLIPQDARPEDEGTFWSMQDMYRAVEKLPCRHFLLILDCCFAGAFRWASTRDVLVPERMYRERFLRFQEKSAWQVLTSASYDQKALDILRDNRGTTLGGGNHSPFAAALFEALTGDKADFIKDEVITATELYLYLRDSVETKSKERQTPGLWPLPKHERGEFFFLTKDFNLARLDKAPTLNPDNNPYRGLKAYEERHGNLFFGRDKLIKRLYTNHIKPNGLTVVVGASGTGKSSLVKAGLVPFLKQASFFERRREFKDTEVWVTEPWITLPILRPGNDPLSALAQMMLPFALEDADTADLHSAAFTALTHFQTVVQARQADLPKSFVQAWQSLEPQPKAQMTLALEWAKTLENWLSRSSSEGLTGAREADQGKLNALISATQACVQHLSQHLIQDDTLLKTLLSDWLSQNPQAHLLLVVDQAEELITQVRDEAARQRFVRYLEGVLAAFPQRLHGVLTVRMDFEPLVQQLFSPPWQTDWTKTCRLVVPPMTQDDLRQAIEGPANEAVLHFEPASLVDELINEVVQMPGALPLLSFVLSELYLKCAERWSEDNPIRALKQEDYERLGKVSGALRHRANEELNAQDEAGQRTLRNIMLRMVALEGGELARRRVPRTELVYVKPEENERVEAILTRLIEQRLVIAGRSAEGEYVEPAHDVLVRGWEKIAEWLKEEVEVQPEPSIRERILNAVFLKQVRKNGKKLTTIKQLKFDPILQRQVTEASEQWLDRDGKRQKSHYLWQRDPRLLQLKQVRDREDWLNKRETEFIDTSIWQRRRWQLKLSGIVISIMATMCLITTLAIIQRNQAIVNQIEAFSALSESRRNEDDQIGSLIASLHGAKLIQSNPHLVNPSLSAKVALSIQESINVFGLREVNRIENSSQEGNSISIAINPMNNSIAITDASNQEIRLYSSQGVLIQKLNCNSACNVLSFSDNGSLAFGDQDGNVYLWNSENNTLDRKKEHDAAVNSVSLSPDGKTLVSLSQDDLIIWEINADALTIKKKHENGGYVSRFSPNGEWFVTTPGIQIWNRDGELITSHADMTGVSLISGIDISPDNETIAIADLNGRIFLLNKNSLDITEETQIFSKHRHGIRGLRFNPDGDKIVSIDDSGTMILWRLHENIIADIILGPEDAVGIEVGLRFWPSNLVDFSKDESFLVSAGIRQGGQIRFWSLKRDFLDPFPGNEAAYMERSNDYSNFDLDDDLIECGSLCSKLLTHLSESIKKIDDIPDGMKEIIRIYANPSKNYILTVTGSGGYGSAQLWDVKGDLISILPSYNSSSFLGFDKDGRILFQGNSLIGSGDNTIYTLSLDTNKLLYQGCQWLQEYLYANAESANEVRSVCSVQ